MKIPLLGDLHFGARGNAQFFLDSTTKFLEEVFFPYMDKHGLTEFIQLGDLMESRKVVGMIAHRTLRTKLLEVAQLRGITGHFITGNHDILHNNTSQFNWLDELIPPEKYTDLIIIRKPTTITRGSVNIDIIPWINKENEAESLKFIEESTSEICIGHFDIVGFEMVSGVACIHGFDRKIFKHYKHVFSGHYHNFSQDDNITYVGCPTQYNWNDYNIQKGFAVLDTESGTFEYVENPVESFKKIIYNDETHDYDKLYENEYANCMIKVIVNEKNDDKMFDSLIERLEAVAYEVDPVDVRQLDIAEDDPDLQVDDSFTILLRTVDDMETKLNRNSIKAKISIIHSEAEEEMLV